MSGARRAYLVTYNVTCLIGWSYCLVQAIANLLNHDTPAELYDAVKVPLQVSQSLALAEVVHSAAGLVRSPVATVAQQVASRIFIVWGILSAAPTAATATLLTLPGLEDSHWGLGLPSLLIAWGITEIIRYTFYALKEGTRSAPYPLLWLRYTTFIVLYPLGVASELALVWLALPELRATRWGCLDMPNAVNLHLEYPVAVMLTTLLYPPGFLALYSYMFKQRKKTLRPSRTKEKAT